MIINCLPKVKQMRTEFSTLEKKTAQFEAWAQNVIDSADDVELDVIVQTNLSQKRIRNS